jgi:hypothetical protein
MSPKSILTEARGSWDGTGDESRNGVPGVCGGEVRAILCMDDDFLAELRFGVGVLCPLGIFETADDVVKHNADCMESPE